MSSQNDINIHMLPAKGGDCFLLEFALDDYRILIDGGYAETYYKYLKPILKDLAAKGKVINLLIITHIDADHINGIKAFLEENGKTDNPTIICVEEVWYNGFFHMNTKEVKKNGIPYCLEEIMKGMALGNDQAVRTGTEEVSVSKGNTVAELLLSGDYNWNSMFNKHAVCLDSQVYLNLSENIELTLLNPGRQQLKDLADYWIGVLKRQVKNFIICENRLYEEAFESYMQWEEDNDTVLEDVSYNSANEKYNWKEVADMQDDIIDTSETNLSSIAFMLEYKGVRMLFPGDCPIQLFMERLPHQIDIVKLPHHGSGKNMCKDFIRNTEVTFYMLSTDGKKYRHPAPNIIGNILCRTPGNPIILKNYEVSFMREIGVLLRYEDGGFTC